MFLTAHGNSTHALIAIEVGLSGVAAALAFGWPNLCSALLKRVEKLFSPLARRKSAAVAVVGLSDLLIRLALLPLFPIPQPFTPDDFSFLLAADTFAHGRLTNPTPAMWTHLESIHVTMRPTYMTMYFPAQGLAMAAGKLLFGHPWFGILAMSALMCASICWMLQAWLPPGWALLGGMLAVLRLGVFSYWTNSYTGAGTISALGGALVLGALPRLMKGARVRHGLMLAVGIALLATSRPYEGLLLCLPVALALGYWILFGKGRPALAILARRAVLPLLVLMAVGAWMGYYDYRAFGSPTTLPYTVDRATYATAPYYVWQPPRPEPAYRHEQLRRFYRQNEMKFYLAIHKPSGYLPKTMSKVHNGLLFLCGFALAIPFCMAHRVVRDRRIRFLLICLGCFLCGMAIEIYLIPHYLGPFIAVFYGLGLQAMRHLRAWKPEGRPVGLALVRFIVVVCVGMAGLRLGAEPLHLSPAEWPPSDWLWEWYGPGTYGTERAQVQAEFEKLPGKQLAIVRYSENHYPLDEWVYNDADLSGAKVIWARDMDSAQNSELIRYYQDRQIWLVQPDSDSGKVIPYPMQAEASSRPSK